MLQSGLNTLILLSAVTLGGCAGEIDGVVTTDFGDAVASTSESEVGDVRTWLTENQGSKVVAELSVVASTGSVELTVASSKVPFDGSASMELIDGEELNLLLYTLWDIDRENPQGTVCTANDLAVCCRDQAWRCQAP